ncbi:MAG: hypothetical protein WD690_09235 [Vicinamibacterales bacterium]
MSHSFSARRLIFVFALAAMPLVVTLTAQQGQGGQQPPAPPVNAPDDPNLRGFQWRSIGPTGQGGRIDDLAFDEKNPSTFYIGYAVSGLWKTVNNGTTFEPIFDAVGHSIGDIALAPSNANILYVGTGEPNNRQSSSFGHGIYKSTDAGKTFQSIGLENTQSIARIVVHPRNPDTVWVAAVGHLFGPNEERGVFMTTDGGTNWTKTLYVSADVGATDLVIDPSNPNNLWAATYERRRQSWGFVGGGAGSGIHQSTDGGRTWRKVTGSGLPRGTMGRIGLDISRSNPNVIYAQIEVAPDREPPLTDEQRAAQQAARGGGAGRGGGGGGQGRGGQQQPPNPQVNGVWRSADRGRTWTFMSNENQRPMYYSQIRVDPNNENVVYVGGVRPVKSLDGGKTWQPLQGMGHVDNHAIWIDPNNSQHVVYGNDGGIDISYDGGATWESNRHAAVGLPYHVSVDMQRPYWVCTGLQDNGSWCGPSSTRSGGIHMWNWISVGGGDGFQTMVDPTDPNIFFTESQNGNINRYDLSTGQSISVRPRNTPSADPDKPCPQAAGRGGGGGGRGGGTPPPPNVIGAEPCQTFNFNWNSPMRMSHFNPRAILYGGNRVFISPNRGDSWTSTVPMGKGIDINTRHLLERPYSLPSCGRTPGEPCINSKHDGLQGNEFGTVIEIAESPVLPGVIWAGTNDGNLQVTRDNGYTWTEVGKNIPGGTREFHVSGLEASWFDAGTAYASIDGHYAGDLKPYVFKTADYGKTWTVITGNLPHGNVNSIRQDPVNQHLLYAAHEFGFFVSPDDGKTWKSFMPGLPKGRVDEVVVHPRDGDLVLASHGRSIWILDDITPLQQLTAETLEKDAVLLTPRDAVLWKTDRLNNTEVPGSKHWEGEVAPRGTAIAFYLKQDAPDVKLTIADTVTGRPFRNITMKGEKGLNRVQWNLAGDPPAQEPGAQQGGGRGGRGGGGGPQARVGVYRVTLSVGGKDAGSQTLRVLEDEWLKGR